MTDPVDEPEPAVEPAPQAEEGEVAAQSYPNGQVLDVPVVNSHVVGVIITEGGGDPQTTAEG